GDSTRRGVARSVPILRARTAELTALRLEAFLPLLVVPILLVLPLVVLILIPVVFPLLLVPFLLIPIVFVLVIVILVGKDEVEVEVADGFPVGIENVSQEFRHGAPP